MEVVNVSTGVWLAENISDDGSTLTVTNGLFFQGASLEAEDTVSRKMCAMYLKAKNTWKLSSPVIRGDYSAREFTAEEQTVFDFVGGLMRAAKESAIPNLENKELDRIMGK